VPPKTVQYIAHAIKLLQGFALLFYFFGEQVAASLRMPIPSILIQMRENKVACGAALYLSHLASSSMVSINAFEVTYNGQFLWSKLKSGSFPPPGEVIKALNLAMTSAAKAAL